MKNTLKVTFDLKTSITTYIHSFVFSVYEIPTYPGVLLYLRGIFFIYTHKRLLLKWEFLNASRGDKFMVIRSCRIHCFADFHDLFALTSKNTHIILSASHFSVLFLSYLYRHPSFFFFSSSPIASLSLSLSHPSYSRPVCTSSFWRLSHCSPSFNLGYFLHLSPLPSLSLSRPDSPTFLALLFLPSKFILLFLYSALSTSTSLFPSLFLLQSFYF